MFSTNKKGNLKFKRRLEPGETTVRQVGKVSKCGMKMHCSNCGGEGYNKKTCTQRQPKLKVISSCHLFLNTVMSCALCTMCLTISLCSFLDQKNKINLPRTSCNLSHSSFFSTCGGEYSQPSTTKDPKSQTKTKNKAKTAHVKATAQPTASSQPTHPFQLTLTSQFEVLA